MSRAERERRLLAVDRWPALQAFVSTSVSNDLLGDFRKLNERFAELVKGMSLSERRALANDCWDFRLYFARRYDYSGMARDGLGAVGKIEGYQSDPEYRSVLQRLMLLYGLLAESIRREVADWKPEVR